MARIPTSKPNVPTVVKKLPTGGSKPSSSERIPYSRLRMTPDDFKKPDGSVDFDALVRNLSLIQDNVHAATLQVRSSPLSNFTIVQSVSMSTGAYTPIKHGLGKAFTYYDCKRVRSGAPFQAQESPNNSGYDPTQYLVLFSPATGVYDIAIYSD